MGSNTHPMGWAQPALPAAHVSAGMGPGPGLVIATAGVAYGVSQTSISSCPACALSSSVPSSLPSRGPAPAAPLCQDPPLWCSQSASSPARVDSSWLMSATPFTLRKVPLCSPFLLLLPFCLVGSSSRVFRVALLGLTNGAAEEPLAAAA